MTKKISDHSSPEETHTPPKAERNKHLLSTVKMDMDELYAGMMKLMAQKNADAATIEPNATVEPTATTASHIDLQATTAPTIDDTFDDDDDDSATIFNVEGIVAYAMQSPSATETNPSTTQQPTYLFHQEEKLPPQEEIDPLESDQATLAADLPTDIGLEHLYPSEALETPSFETAAPTEYSMQAVPEYLAMAFEETPAAPSILPEPTTTPQIQVQTPQVMVEPQRAPQTRSATVFAQEPSNPFESTLDKPMISPLFTKEPTPQEEEEEEDDYEDSGSLFGMSTMGGYLAKFFGVGKIGDFLRGLAFFEGIGRTSLMRLSQKVKVLKYEPNQVIMRRGQTGDSMYILAQGDVQVLLRQNTVAGETLRVIPLHVGDVFGEMGLLTGNPRTADIVSISKSVCLEIQKRDVEALCAQHPPMSRFLTAILGERLRSTQAITNVGRIEILREIGAGATAFVYAARLKDGGQPVALKMLSHELAYDKSFRLRFLEEARILAQLRHPHIVQFYGTEEAYATVFLVMEMVEGSNLDAYLEQKHRFSFEECHRMLLETASALHYAHENGIVHRDIKPANLLMNRQKHIKVTDFGLAVQPTKDKEVQSTQKPEGSPSYMAPEQIMWQPVDRRADIYALGITAFKMLTGTLPFQGSIEHIFQQHASKPLPDLYAYDPTIPPKLVDFVQKATAKAKEARFQTCQEILHALT